AKVIAAREKVDNHATQLRAAQDRDRLEAQISAAESAVETARKAVEAQHGHWMKLRHDRQAGIAAELAVQLEKGQPCPVCGAVDHPLPARPAADTPSKEEEEAAERRLDELRARHEEMRQQLEATRRDHTRLDGT